jgi:putative DNA primase/helicase
VVIPQDQQNKTLAAELEGELPGIFNWALEGLKRLLQQGDFTYCDICAEAARQHRFDCDPVAQFLDECVGFPAPDSGEVYEIEKDELYQEYRGWSKRNGDRALTSNKFNRRIGKLDGVTDRRQSKADRDGRRPWIWIGLGKPVPKPPGSEDDENASQHSRRL